MIQIYSPDNTDYSKNGNMVIFPTSCYAESRLKGEWKLTLSHPLDEEGRWKYIVENAVISVPTFIGAGQLYRITYVEKTDTGVDAEAIPVFFDSANEIFLLDTRPTNKNGQEALNIMLSGHTDKYSATSDISKRNTAYYVRKNFIEALNNEDEEDTAFVKRWGGEPIYRNYLLEMNDRAGQDRGVYILYGKNIQSISETIDTAEIATRIIPVSGDGYILDGNAPWVDSLLINSYPIVYTKTYTYDDIRLADSDIEDDEGYPDLPSLRAALRLAAQAEYDGGIDKPKVNLTINMIDLSRTDMYKDYSALETVSLGDTVHCKHSVLEITTDARVIYIRWDCVRDCVDTVEIGEAKYDYFSALNTAINSKPKLPAVFDENGNVMAEYISGVLDLANTRLQYQKNNSQRSDVRAILYEDTAETIDGEPNPQYGALCIGTAGIQIAHEKNAGGEWIWGTAIDFNSIQAGHIITGILADQTGTNYWNLNTGEFRLSTQAEVSQGLTLEDFIKSTSGVESITYSYGTSASPSVVPVTWSSTVPSWQDGVYIWYKTTTTRYDDNTGSYISTDTTPVCLTGNVGPSGSQGPKGDKGDDGTSVTILGSYSTEAELRAAHPTGSLGDGYLVAGYLYVWNGSDWQNVGQIKGDKGDDGADGISSYTHLAYSTSSDGRTNFSTTWFSGATYIGFRIDQTQADSQLYSDYDWSLIKGDPGANGSDGVGIVSSVEQYYLSTSASTQTGGSWSTTMPTWESGKYIWTRLYITWTEGSPTTTTPVLAKAINSANENAKAAQNAVTALDQSLNQTAIFNRLTNNGAAQGIFMQNGQLYINMSYLATGILKVGGLNNAEGQIEFYDELGGKYGWINNNRAVFYNTSAASSNFNTIRVYGPDSNSEIEYAADIAGVLIGEQYGSTSDDYAHIGPDSAKNGLRIDGNLQVKDWSNSFRKPVTSYATDKNRVAYLAAHSSTHTVPNSIGINAQYGTTTYSTKNFAPSSSDVRLKENIEDCDISALPFVESIQMRQFDWKRNGVHQECGFVADELEKLDPNLSIGGGYDPDGSMNEKSVNDFYLLGYLTKAVQELSAKVKDLEAKLENSPG